MVWLYLLSLIAVVAAVFLIFILGLNIYHALVDIFYYSSNYYLVMITSPLYSIMSAVRYMALQVSGRVIRVARAV